MDQQKDIRQLAGIVFTDIVGFTHLMDEDESTARDILKRQRKLIHPIVKLHEGKVLKEMGDGYLLMFTSVLNAVHCAMAIQKAEKDFTLRIGIHIGDVVIEDDDIYGTGVNVASRIENLAPPGGIFISSDVWHQINNQSDLSGKSLGMKNLKGVSTPVEVYELYSSKSLPSRGVKSAQTSSKNKKEPLNSPSWIQGKNTWVAGILLALFLLMGLYVFTPDQTASSAPDNSIAVLPFENLSSDSDDAYFADGVHEDIIVHLSQIGDIRVIARSSVLSFMPGERNLTTIANELNVISVLEGSIRRAGDVIRVSVQLIDPLNNQTLWADIYDRDITDLFKIQSEIAREIAGALEVRMTANEERAIERVHTEDIDAYRLYVLGRGLWNQRTEDAIHRSADYFQQAIEQDPEYALAWAGLADALSTIKFYNFSSGIELKAEEAARQALELSPKLGEAQASLGIAYAVNQNGSKAVGELEQAIKILPSYAEAHLWLGWLHLILGEPTASLSSLEQAVRLNPLAPAARVYLAEGYLANGQNHEALREAQHARTLQPEYGFAHYMEALVLYHLERYTEAKSVLQKALPLVRPGGIPNPSNVQSLLALTHVSLGDKNTARDILTQIRDTENPFSTGLVYISLGEEEKGFRSFERIPKWDSIPTIHLRYLFPVILGKFHSDPRYQQFLKEVGRSWE